jgi:benzoate membrane transport protein
MMSMKDWLQVSSAALTAIVVGFASTILLIMEAARAVGAGPAEQASWAMALCVGMAVTSLILSWWYRIPIITAWSTPGAALIATSAAGVSYENALGAFVVAGLLMCLAAAIRPLARVIERIPGPVASAMLGGVLLVYCLRVPGAALEMPVFVVGLAAAYFALRLALPLFAVPAIVGAGIILAFVSGSLAQQCCHLGLTLPVWTTPGFDLATILSLGVPLFLVTMASQNLPGFAVIKAAGYQPPVSGSLWVTGAGSVVLAPFGSHAINLAAITAAIVTGPECHPDPQKRWMMAWPYALIYLLIGVTAASFVEVLGALPKPLITTIAGLALFGPLLGSVAAMFKDARDVEAAMLTFLVTASGLTVFGVGSAFWGLLAGLLLYAARHLHGQLRRQSGPP